MWVPRADSNFFLPIKIGYALFKVSDDAKLAQIAANAEANDFSTVATDNLLMLKGKTCGVF